MSYIHQETQAKTWAPKPLNAKGNLTQWQRRMNEACPAPMLNEVIWLNGEYWDQVSRTSKKSSVAYKAIGFKYNGEVIWQRGQVIELGDSHTIN